MEKIICPNCKQEFKTAENKKYLDCPFCNYEFKSPNEPTQSKDNEGKNNAKEKFEKLFKNN